MELRKLEKTEEANYSEYIKSWKAEKIVPTSSDDKGKAFNNFLKKLKSDEIENNGRVPSETYFLFMKNGEIAGAINCRYALNEHLREIGGHIGYGVSPNYRNQGIATTMLRLVLDSYREKNFDRVMLTADDENQGSVKTILSCGGKLYETGKKEQKSYGKYWIEL